MVDFDVLMHDGKTDHNVVGYDFSYDEYIYDNSYNIISAVDDHEWFHQNDPNEQGNREARACAYQLNSGRFSNCTDKYRKLIDKRLSEYNK